MGQGAFSTPEHKKKIISQRLIELSLELEREEVTKQKLQEEKELNRDIFQLNGHREKYWRLKSRSI